MNCKSNRILLVLAVGLLAGWANTAQATICSNKLNPFIKNLVSGGVELLKLPKKIPNECGTEWKVYGTCCEVSSLVEYATKDIEGFQRATVKLTSELDNLIGAVGLAATFAGISNQGKLRKASKDKKAEAEIEYLKAKNLFLKVKQVGDDSYKHLAVIKADKVCVNRLSKLRSASYCNTCAKRSPRFFKDGKALMSMETCKQTISDCHDYWFALITIIDNLASIDDQIQFFKQKFGNSDLAEKFETDGIEYLQKWLLAHKLRERFETCPSVANCQEQSASAICSSLISIRSQGPIYGAVSHAGAKEQALSNKSGKQSNYSDRRILNSDPFSLLGLTNVDICVVPSSMQLGANQATMNFDLQFP